VNFAGEGSNADAYTHKAKNYYSQNGLDEVGSDFSCSTFNFAVHNRSISWAEIKSTFWM